MKVVHAASAGPRLLAPLAARLAIEARLYIYMLHRRAALVINAVRSRLSWGFPLSYMGARRAFFGR
jgi:hypothetical protein